MKCPQDQVFSQKVWILLHVTLATSTTLRVSNNQLISAKLQPNSSRSTEYVLSLVWWAEYFQTYTARLHPGPGPWRVLDFLSISSTQRRRSFSLCAESCWQVYCRLDPPSPFSYMLLTAACLSTATAIIRLYRRGYLSLVDVWFNSFYSKVQLTSCH